MVRPPCAGGDARPDRKEARGRVAADCGLRRFQGAHESPVEHQYWQHWRRTRRANGGRGAAMECRGQVREHQIRAVGWVEPFARPNALPRYRRNVGSRKHSTQATTSLARVTHTLNPPWCPTV